MDQMFSFPADDKDVFFQVGSGYDIPTRDDLRFFSSEKVLQEHALDIVDWERISNFGLLDAVEISSNGNLLVGSIEGDENPGYDCWSAGGGVGQGSMIKPRRDRSKAIASERKRRGRMKEKLYELRALVPNITKMDKASIIADAIVYVRALQKQEKILAEEIAVLKSSSFEEAAMQRKQQQKNRYRGEILGVVAHEIGEKKFLVQIECNREDGASSFLCRAIETLECFKLVSSIIACTPDRYICSLTFNRNEGGHERFGSEILGDGRASQGGLPLYDKCSLLALTVFL